MLSPPITMLFTRLAIAALSLDSITRVFAAPIVAGLAGNKVALSLPVLGAPFEVLLDYTIATLAPLKDQLGESVEYLPPSTQA